MTQPPTISAAPPAHPGMDFARLRAEGIAAIAQLVGREWTDYNAADPGITLLEALCYAITDLSYRLAFEMEDLLAAPTDDPHPPEGFLTARTVLTMNPLTINDYRKLLIDLDGIRNAWLEPISQPQPELYYLASRATLTLSPHPLADPVNLRGLYRVLLAKASGYSDAEVIATATARLQQQRNLCEDFAEIRVLPIEAIRIQAEIEIGDRVNPNRLIAELYTALAQAIAPRLQFSSLQEQLAQDIPVEALFVGPALDHGFLDDAELEQFERQTELYTSDLIQILLDHPGINIVRRLMLASDRTPTPQPWALDLDPQLTPQLISLDRLIAAGDIRFYKGQIPCVLDPVAIAAAAFASPTPPHQPSDLSPPDLPLPKGNYRELASYTTLQTEFPLNYGIGEVGLPATATPERQAQAKQLQAYLLVFDQLLANYFAQLDQVRNLFSWNHHQLQTYFAQSIAHFPGAQEILKSSYADYLQGTFSDPQREIERKNRFLDHLLAQYGETFTDLSLLYPGQAMSSLMMQQKFIDHKINFLQDYPRVSAGRGQAFNYTLNPQGLELAQSISSQNISGLKRRIARRLGIEPQRQFLGSSETTEGFYLLEHLLLRPRSVAAAPAEQDRDFLTFSKRITALQAAERSGYVTCFSEGHGLQNGDRIEIFNSVYYNGIHTVDFCQEHCFDIFYSYLPETSQTIAWVRQGQSPDPFSFQMSVILPDWPGRFQLPNFRQLVIETVMAETPAHITLYFHWCDRPTLTEFETTHAIWLQQLAGQTHDRLTLAESSLRLIQLLRLGSSEILKPPALLGYMRIVGDEQQDTENLFTIL
ncbi:MAG: hypothetical protein AAGG51_20145 [Cyanobacteria bacterium P01_G01_bin.54]